MKQIHIRIEEKWSDYRSAFRSIDQNFDGGLSFQEFVAGCEFSGIQLPIKDYRLVFDVLDYDKKGEVDFRKFCLINTDKSKTIFGQIDELNRLKVKQDQVDEHQELKEKYDQLVQLQTHYQGKVSNPHNKTKELLQLQQKLAENLKKPPLHKDYHKYMKKKHYQKAVPYSRLLRKEEPPLPKSRDMNQFQTDVSSPRAA